MTFVVGAAEALELLTAAVNERGERYVYPERDDGSCYYWHGGEENEPGCLVGLALAKAGVSEDDLKYLDGPAGCGAYRLHLAPLHGVKVTDQAAEIFQAAQSQQDSLRSWGEALEAAKRQAEEYGIQTDWIAA